jgi:hypothetical protein
VEGADAASPIKSSKFHWSLGRRGGHFGLLAARGARAAVGDADGRISRRLVAEFPTKPPHSTIASSKLVSSVTVVR